MTKHSVVTAATNLNIFKLFLKLSWMGIFMTNKAVASEYQSLIFKSTKYVVIFLSVLSLLGVIWSSVMLATTFGSKFESPVYGESSAKKSKKHSDQIDTSAEGKLALTTKHGGDIIKLLGRYNLDKDRLFDQIIGSMLRVPTDLQGKYLSSSESWMEASAKAGIKAEQGIYEFDNAFHQAIADAARQENSVEMERVKWIGMAGTGAIFFACLVIVLVLIQIEVNTRVTAELLFRGNFIQPAPSDQTTKPVKNSQGIQASNVLFQQPIKALTCPKCGASAAEADIFCEGCGSKLK